MNILPIVALNELEEHSTDYVSSKKDSAFKKIYQLPTHKLPKNEKEWTKRIKEVAKTVSLGDTQIEHQNQNKDKADFINSFESYKPLLTKDKESEQNILDHIGTLDNLSEFRNNIHKLDDKKLEIHYENIITILNTEQNSIKEGLFVLKNIIYEAETSKGLATPNIFPRVVEGKTKDMNLYDLYKTKQNDIKDLEIILQSVAPDIYNKLTNCRKEELENYILENSQEIISYIDGAKFNILEDRAFCSLRFKAVEAFEQGLVVSPSTKISCKPSDIYKLSGVHYNNGYDTKQRLAIKDAVTNQDGNLRKCIHIEYPQKHKDGNAILSTNFIKYVDWNDEKDRVIFEIDSIFFVNIPNEPTKKYWTDDIEGRNKYITQSFKKGFQNENAYRLHRYLASSLRTKNKTQEYNVLTLLEHSGLITDFNNRKKTVALSKLQEYLDKMYEHNTLIKNKPIKVNSKSDKYGKYELERLK